MADTVYIVIGVIVGIISIVASIYMFAQRMADAFKLIFVVPAQKAIQDLTISIDELKKTIKDLIGNIRNVENRVVNTENDIEVIKKNIKDIKEDKGRTDKDIYGRITRLENQFLR